MPFLSLAAIGDCVGSVGLEHDDECWADRQKTIDGGDVDVRKSSIWTAGAEGAGQATRIRQAEGWLNLGSVDSGACGALGDQPPKLLSKAPSEVAQSVLY